MTIPKSLLVGRFFEYLLAANRGRLVGFKHWLFHPGMLFRARQQWWGGEQTRSNPHEGLDLCYFEDMAGRRHSLDQTIVIPVPCPGRIVKISRDFLGQSIFVAHDMEPIAGCRLYTAFGHTAPEEGLSEGKSVSEGEIIASISAPDQEKTAVPPHLHLTLALIPDTVTPDQLTWAYLGSGNDHNPFGPAGRFPHRLCRAVKIIQISYQAAINRLLCPPHPDPLPPQAGGEGIKEISHLNVTWYQSD